MAELKCCCQLNIWPRYIRKRWAEIGYAESPNSTNMRPSPSPQQIACITLNRPDCVHMYVRVVARAIHRAIREGLDAGGKDHALRLDAVAALVPGVQGLLSSGGASAGPQLAIQKADEVVHWDWDPLAYKGRRKMRELRRPGRKIAVVYEMREHCVDVLDHGGVSLGDGGIAASGLADKADGAA